MSSRQVSVSLLLDTHIWIWLMTGDARARSVKLQNRVEQAASKQQVFVSIISVWELAMLEAKGRIDLSLEPLEWVQRALREPGVSLAPLTPEIAVASTRLPASFPGDPADRLLVATARSMQLTLVTADKRILRYADHSSLKVLEL
jgi:PIN domain nuclease of toxin-antitoxin system